MEKKEDEIDILVCARTTGMPRPVYGSVRADCLECKSPVWVSASGQKAMAGNKNLKPCCMECAHEKMKDDDDVKASIVPGAIDELRRHFLKIEDN